MARTQQWLPGAENAPGQPARKETGPGLCNHKKLPSATTTSSKRVSNFRREQSQADTSTTVSCDPEQRTGRQSPDAQELSR